MKVLVLVPCMKLIFNYFCASMAHFQQPPISSAFLPYPYPAFFDMQHGGEASHKPTSYEDPSALGQTRYSRELLHCHWESDTLPSEQLVKDKESGLFTLGFTDSKKKRTRLPWRSSRSTASCPPSSVGSWGLTRCWGPST